MQYMEFLKQVVEEGDSGICFLDPQGCVLYWNPAAERITGWKAGDVAGKLILSVYTPESRVEEHENFHRLAAGGDISFRCERDILKPDGQIVSVEVYISKVFKEKTLIGYWSTFRDVSGARRQRQLEALYQNLIENSDDTIYHLDAQGRFTYLNPFSEDLTGYKPEELIGKHFASVLTPAAREIAKANFAKGMAGELPRIRYELELLRKDGTTKIIELSTSTWYEGGRPIGRQGVVRDITQRKALERQAEELAKLKESLTQMLVHDLKNPAVALGGYLELVAGQEGHDENTVKWLNGMQSSLFFLNEIIANILDVSRLEGGHVPLSWEHWRVADVVGEVLKDTALMARAKDLRVQFIPLEAEAVVHGDRQIVRRILINLISNAVKFSLSGKDIFLSTEIVEKSGHLNGPAVKVSVSDQGYGISPENQLRIFDKFYSTAPSRGGIGLGLAFCKLAVEAHGGKITVESETDKGSTFTVFLPAGSPQMVGDASVLSSGKAGSG